MIRRYRIGQLDRKRLATQLPEAALTGALTNSPLFQYLDIPVDDALGDVLEDLEEFLANHGFVFIEEDPSIDLPVLMQSPNGDLWDIQVNNSGVVSGVAFDSITNPDYP